MHPFLSEAQKKRGQTIDLIQAFVECESPSGSAADLKQFLALISEETRDIAIPKIIRCGGPVPCLRLDCKLPGRPRASRILGLGHADTVWQKGMLNQMPFRKGKGRLWGPGVLDMKAGLAFFLMAVRLLRDLDVEVAHQVALLIVPDEETGSTLSRAFTESEARKSDAVLVLEPGTGLTGKLKTARKAIGRYLVRVQGKAAHAGVDFENGSSAIVELAKQVGRLSELTDLERGTTVNPGVIQGGTRSNVIAAEASVEVDMRAVTLREAERTDRKLHALKPVDRRCSVAIEGGINRPPMERNAAMKKLYARACGIAGEMGMTLEESSTGGGSDGNFTAALGVPTLDGLGAVGEGAHAENESILVNRIADRVALLAGLMARL